MVIRCLIRQPIFRLLSANKGSFRQSSSSSELLKDRTVLSVQRESCVDFLQGLITNDVNLLASNKCIYSMILNSKGRVLYDVFIYKTESFDKFFIECGTEVADAVTKHLKVYSLRKKIDVSKSNLSVWAAFQQDSSTNCKIVADPRCREPWIYRCLSDSQPTETLEEGLYSKLRYSLGIAEGPQEIPVGEAFPLEYNLDFLNGVSFDKGCYVGQELTARVHHTGVIRKRIMPLELSKGAYEDCNMQESITDSETGKAVGKVRGVDNNRALALMRIKETISSKGLIWGRSKVRAIIPSWWPPLMKDSIVQ